MSLDRDVDFLGVLHVQDVQGCAAALDHLEDLGIFRVGLAVQGPVVDGEAVCPKMENSLDAFGGLGSVGGWIGYVLGRNVFAAKGMAAAGKV